MAQGSYKKSGGKPGVVAKSRRVNKGKTAVKKGSWVLPPKQQRLREAAKEERVTTKAINNNNEQQAAAKCYQNQEKLFLSDVRESGRELARDIKRKALTRKKTRAEEKLTIAKEKLERVERKHAS